MKKLFFCLALISSQLLFAQIADKTYRIDSDGPNWMHLMYQENPNLFEVKDAFEAYYQSNKLIKNQHTQYYKRLMKNRLHLVDANGFVVRDPNLGIDEFVQKSSLIHSGKAANSEWEEAGPWQYDHEQAMAFEVQSPGSAHVQTVEQSASEPNTVWAGTATAGAWKSIDKGLTWDLMTRDIPVNEVYSIAIDPMNENNVLISGNSRVYKTTDGGVSWNELPSFEPGRVRDMKFVNNDENIILVASANGLMRSDDFGATFTAFSYEEHMELEQHPIDPSIWYTVRLSGSKTEFYKSLDYGVTWTIKTNGWPNPPSGDENKRCEIAISEADPTKVYVWASGTGDGHDGFYGLYVSNDAGESFNFQCCGSGPGGVYDATNPNMLTWSENADEDGGQYYYDLAFDISPNDADRMFGAGINTW